MPAFALYSRRYGAYLIDVAIVAVLAWLLSAVVIKTAAPYLPAVPSCNLSELRGVHYYDSAQILDAASARVWNCMVIAMNRGAAPQARYPNTGVSADPSWPQIVRITLAFAVAWSYFALLESSRFRTTCGKRMLRLKVTGRSSERITLWRASMRFLITCISLCSAYVIVWASIGVADRHGSWLTHPINAGIAAIIVLITPMVGMILGDLIAIAIPLHDMLTNTLVVPTCGILKGYGEREPANP